MISKQRDSRKSISITLTEWVGTPASIVAHSILFIAIFALKFVGLTIDQILLILTTAVSLEAIYLAIFIQMTVNRHAAQIEEVGEDIEDIQEDVQEISEDVEEISEDIEGIHKEQQEDNTEGEQTQETLTKIEHGLQTLLKEIEHLKQRGTHHTGQ